MLMTKFKTFAKVDLKRKKKENFSCMDIVFSFHTLTTFQTLKGFLHDSSSHKGQIPEDFFLFFFKADHSVQL